MMTLYTGIEVTKNVFGSLCTSKHSDFIAVPSLVVENLSCESPVCTQLICNF